MHIYEDLQGNKIHLTDERQRHIYEREELIGQDDKIAETLKELVWSSFQ